MKKISFFVAVIIAIAPFSAIRKLLYKIIFGYSFGANVQLGYLNVIHVPKFVVGSNSKFASFNLFKGPFTVSIGDGVRIGRGNIFTAAWSILNDKFKNKNYKRELQLCDDVLVLDSHFFDVYGKIYIGKGTWIAGRGTQMWTHGVSVMDRDITIGSYNYIGSAVRVSPGTTLGDSNIVALGSVLVRGESISRHLISGCPAKPIKILDDDSKYKFSFMDW
ncbi:acyltransferase [Azonexus hydrophilus]|uniref:acyltransferase n=1 Tax=Azonexus hydrophilus TaxID=418702 RepID=UPI001115A320|nr:hypothetical protein [Azonexus hydrophilus]